MDYNETLEDAATRELYEESGLVVEDIPKENIIYGLDNSPWKINSLPKDLVQNVSFRFGLIFKVKDKSCLPKLSTDFCETNEVIESVWLTTEECLSILNNKSDFNPESQKTWAFNHYDFYREWLEKSQEILNK